MKLIEDVTPEIQKDTVYRLLGKRKGRMPSVRTANRVRDLMLRTESITKPKIVYTTRAIKKVGKETVTLEDETSLKSRKLSRSLRECDRVTIFLATIGRRLDSEIHSLMNENKVAEAYMLDAIGSAAVEGTVEEFQKKFDSLAEKNRKATTLRFSPGYCDWHIREQRKLFDIIDNRLVGVELNQSSLMTPRKSITGVFGIGDTNRIDRNATNPCKECGMKSCIARRT